LCEKKRAKLVALSIKNNYMSFIYTEELIQKGFTYETYLKHAEAELKNYDVSIPKEETLKIYAEKNLAIMKQLYLKASLKDELKQALIGSKKRIWLVLTEGWCGDAAQAIPLFQHMSEASEGKIDLRFLLRDKNLDLMDLHLTNGGRSIPKLIVLDSANLKVLTTWGPRPESLQVLMNQWKNELKLPFEDLIEKVGSWYKEDNSLSTQNEMLNLIKVFH
jgi:hypothetical protein